jgi:pimeloyl-ACP methyl ester carboxylesterase
MSNFFLLRLTILVILGWACSCSSAEALASPSSRQRQRKVVGRHTKYTNPATTLPPTPSLPPALETGYINTDINVSIWYAIFGRPLSESLAHGMPPLLFLHGGFGNSDYFGHQVASLLAAAATHRQEEDATTQPPITIITLDSRGQGRSTGLTAPISYDLMAADVLHSLDHFSIPKCTIAGWSDGGIIGLAIAMSAPHRLARLFAFAAQYSYANTNASVATAPTFQAYLARTQREYGVLNPSGPQGWPVLLQKLMSMYDILPNWSEGNFTRIPTPASADPSPPLIWVVDAADEEVVDLDTPRTMHDWVSGSFVLLLFGFFRLCLQRW